MDNKSRRLSPARAAIAGLALAALPMASFAFVSVGVSITIAPPAIPVYVQPPCPAVGYIWTPGYWAYGDDDYYWVPGTWVLAPSPGLLWTPGYWGWSNGFYAWHEGYWGPHVGFYGGVNYGYGYGGVGFEGGYWRGGAFYYNRSVSNLGGVHITNVYNKTVINNVNVTRVSYNGGEGGLRARPTSRELAAEHDRHVAFTSMQRNQEHAAFTNHDLRASVNQGRPRIAATQRPGAFTGHGVEAARAGEWHGGGDRAGAGRGADVRAADRGGLGHGGPEHGGADRVANRSDRPPGASGSAEVHGATGGGPAVHNDRPSMGGNRGVETRGGPAAVGTQGGLGNGGRGAESRGGPGAVGTQGGRGNGGRGAESRGGPGAAGTNGRLANGGRGGEPANFAAGRSDRPAGATGAAEGHGGPGGAPAVHNDRPSMGNNRGDAGAHFTNRNDRPPGAGSPEVHGGASGGAGGPGAFNNRTETHEQPRMNVARSDRPSQPIGGSPGANRNSQPHFNQSNEMHNMSQGPRSGGSPQASPREFNGGGAAAPRQQMAPRPQMAPAPRPEAATRPQNVPRPDVHRGGGEPHGQGGGRPQGPQARGGDHGRR